MSTVEVKSGEVIVIPSRVVQVVSVGVVGPQGPAGSSEDLSFEAGENLSARRAVFLQEGSCFAASSNTASNAAKVLGVSVAAAAIGNPTTIRVSGSLSGFSGLTVDSPIYLAADGSLTHILPVTGFILQLGVAIAPDKVLIHIKQPIGLV